MSEQLSAMGAYAHGGSVADIVHAFIERFGAGVRVSRAVQARSIVRNTARRYSDSELIGFGWKGAEIRRLKCD